MLSREIHSSDISTIREALGQKVIISNKHVVAAECWWTMLVMAPLLVCFSLFFFTRLRGTRYLNLNFIVLKNISFFKLLFSASDSCLCIAILAGCLTLNVSQRSGECHRRCGCLPVPDNCWHTPQQHRTSLHSPSLQTMTKYLSGETAMIQMMNCRLCIGQIRLF